MHWSRACRPRTAVLAVLALVCAHAASAAGTRDVVGLRAVFGKRSYRPGDVALLRIVSSPSRDLTLDVFRVGDGDALAPPAAKHDRTVAGLALEPSRRLVGPAAPWTLHLPVGRWPSGVYVARLVAPDGEPTYAPFVLRPAILGALSRVLVVEPTNTWQAYDFYGGDSWYENPAVHAIDLGRPYLGLGLPPHFTSYDVGFLRWYAASGRIGDFVSDDDLGDFADAATLRRLYDLVVFPGHEEYVTSHVFDLVRGFRDRGGSVAFLSANNFFYAVRRAGSTMLGRTHWRDLGRPESSLVGIGLVGWDHFVLRNRPYVVGDTGAAPWLFRGTGLHDGSQIPGSYGIEIDARDAASPRGTRVLARIPDEFGPGLTAEMTWYGTGPHSGVFAAGTINFGSSARIPAVGTMIGNLWDHALGR